MHVQDARNSVREPRFLRLRSKYLERTGTIFLSTSKKFILLDRLLAKLKTYLLLEL